MPANYNKLAPFYDAISSMVFGHSIINAQQCLVPFISTNCSILIVGGGTGKILENMAQKHPSGLHIDYVEASSKMISLAQKKDHGNNHIKFINLPIEKFSNDGLYDVMITPFILDNFDAQKAPIIFNQLNKLLRPGGLWLYADFVMQPYSPWWQKSLLRVMYLFFRFTTGIETSQLVSIDQNFDGGYDKIFEKGFYANFITARVYQKI